ncbi:helix-turn-helix transcriptional regulator [Rhizobium binae]|uniref:helix-turn-helix domain-containing protein n=1 Tax=Rhizobium binae TaxID=1138190 RepID=UPI001C82B785|nr:AraC family transcriptional regulator [Rhizobium binae]MBX4949613.1 helix-turn-helix transcriptional regulator [Rhizobium binae]
MEFLSRHRIFASGDLDEGASFAGQVWERNRSVKTDKLRYGIRWNQQNLDNIGFSYIEHDCAVDLTAQGPLSDHFRIFINTSGAIDHRVDGREFQSHSGNTIAHSPGADLHLDIRPFKLLLLTVDGALINNAMRERFRKLPPYSNWLGVLHESPSLQTMRSMTTWLAQELDQPLSPIRTSGKPQLHAERLLMSLIVESIAASAPVEAERALAVSHAQVRRAAEWIDAHLAEAVGIEEVAAAVGIGVRSLQMSFKRIFGCSPSEYMMARRLDEAHQRLSNATHGSTVTSVATELGFFELGRFATRYRQRFAEPPSATLSKYRGEKS